MYLFIQAAMARELISITPKELQFSFELNKQISCTTTVQNNTHNYVAFKVKTTHPKKYCVQPNVGIVSPHSTCDFSVTMQAQKEAPVEMICKDKFLIQSVIISPNCTIKDLTSDTFNKEFDNRVGEYKMNVKLVSPPKPVVATLQKASGRVSAPKTTFFDCHFRREKTTSKTCAFMSGSKPPTLTATSDVSMIYTQLLVEQRERHKLEQQLQREMEVNRKFRNEIRMEQEKNNKDLDAVLQKFAALQPNSVKFDNPFCTNCRHPIDDPCFFSVAS